MGRLPLGAMLVAALAAVALTSEAIVAAARQTPTFRSGVDIVQLDVSVLDRERRPVRGLSAQDFVLLEDGKPQKVAAFSPVDLAAPSPSGAQWTRDVAADVRSNAPVDHRLIALVIDDGAVEFDAHAIASLRQAAGSVINRLGPSDLASVVFTRDNRQAQNFTADRARLLAAADATPAMSARDGGPMDEHFIVSSAQVLDEAIRALASVPDRRKIVIYVGSGLPFDLGEVASPVQPVALGSPVSNGLLALKVFGLMKDALSEARKANINVYAIDACGLRVPQLAPPPPPRTCQPGLEIDYLQTIAEGTGGRAVINTNQFETGVDAIFRENGSYYLLGYQPARPVDDGKFHRIEVTVNRPDVVVRTRNGYESAKPAKAGKPDSAAAAAAASPLSTAMSGVLPMPDIALQAVALPFASGTGKDTTIAILLGVRQADLASADRRVVETLDLQMSAFTPEGKRVASQRQTARVVVRAGATGVIQYEAFSRMDLKPGRYELRLAAHSGLQNRRGSVYLDVDVPDFGKQMLALSGLVLSAEPSPASAGREGLASIVPVPPTTRRQFLPADRVAAFVRVYRPRRETLADLKITTTIESSDGARAFERSEPMELGAFSSAGAADYRVDLPLGRLARGAYLLTIEAAALGTTASRQVRFEVR